MPLSPLARKTFDRRLRRAVTGALVGAALGALIGALLGEIEAELYTGAALFGAIAGAQSGAAGGLLIGSLIILRDDGKRRGIALTIGGLVGLATGLDWGLRLAVHLRTWEGFVIGSRWHLETVLAITVLATLAGLIGGWSVTSIMDRLRRRWPWMTRWDPDPQPAQ